MVGGDTGAVRCSLRVAAGMGTHQVLQEPCCCFPLWRAALWSFVLELALPRAPFDTEGGQVTRCPCHLLMPPSPLTSQMTGTV